MCHLEIIKFQEWKDNALFHEVIFFIQSSDSVSLDLLTFADLESLRQRKVGTAAAKTSIPANRTVSLNSKRYLILTYTVEFDR